MFQVFMLTGWAALLILLLYIWADVREIAGIVKDSKRELLRSNFGGRTSGRMQLPWQEEDDVAQKMQAFEKNTVEKEPKEAILAGQSQEAESRKKLVGSEERILQEVLTEFLG